MRAVPIGCALRRATRERFARGVAEPAVKETRVPPNRARDVTRIMTLFAIVLRVLRGSFERDNNQAAVAAEVHTETCSVYFNRRRHCGT